MTRVELDAAPTDRDRQPTSFLDSADGAIVAFAQRVTVECSDDRERAVALFETIRDSIRYDPYDVSRAIDDYRASAILDDGQKWCVPKAVLLSAAARAIDIPARLGFADVKNHLQSEKLSAQMGGSDLFAWHGYSVLFIDGQWRKASPAFNRSMCERFGTKVLDFDGRSDALLHPFDTDGNRHMEYVADRGVYDDLPFDEIMDTFDVVYPDMGNGDTHDEMFHGD